MSAAAARAIEAPPLARPGARLLAGLFAGAISGTLVVTFGITLAALLFSGDLAGSLPAGIGIVLASSCVVGAAVALQSSYAPVIAAPQENTTVILAVVAATLCRRVTERADAFPTVVAALALASLATGALLLALGLLRLGKVVRFVPYPVVGGFLAATGWLLAQGSLSVMAGAPMTFGNLPLLLAPGALASWLPGVGFGVVLTVLLRRFHHFLLLPALLAGGIALFYGALAVAGLRPADAMDRGWLVGPFTSGTLWAPLGPSSLAHVEWAAIRESAGSLAAVALLAALSLLLNASGLEHATEQEIDLDRELRATGLANLAVGALGGVAGYLSLSESTLNHRVGARSRAPGLVCAALCGVTVVAGAATLSYFPKPVLGGLLLFLGLSFLLETVWDAWFRLPRSEYAVVLLILVVVLGVGFLEGVGAGLVVSAVLFAVNYASVDIVKSAISGELLRSKVHRTLGEEAILRREGARIEVLQLQGYVFFGTSYALLRRARERLLSRTPVPVRYLLLDFRKVDGIDSSAVVSFTRMRKLAEAQGAELVLTELSPGVRRQLERGGCLDAPGAARPPIGPAVKVSPDLDAGLDWCEKRLLAASLAALPGAPETADAELEALLVYRELVANLRGYLERVAIGAGAEIYRQGELSRDLYVIESGELEAWLDLGDGRERRLRTMGTGSVVGELGFYLAAPRSASVRTTEPTTLYRLSEASLARMSREAPYLASGFHRFVACLLAERMARTTSAAHMRFF